MAIPWRAEGYLISAADGKTPAKEREVLRRQQDPDDEGVVRGHEEKKILLPLPPTDWVVRHVEKRLVAKDCCAIRLLTRRGVFA